MKTPLVECPGRLALWPHPVMKVLHNLGSIWKLCSEGLCNQNLQPIHVVVYVQIVPNLFYCCFQIHVWFSNCKSLESLNMHTYIHTYILNVNACKLVSKSSARQCMWSHKLMSFLHMPFTGYFPNALKIFGGLTWNKLSQIMIAFVFCAPPFDGMIECWSYITVQ